MRSGRSEDMNALYQSAKVQYAVIQLSDAADPPERLILAYPDEETLRALIAEPSIVGLGFGSREEAVSTEYSALDKAVAPRQANEVEADPVGWRQTHSGGDRAAEWSSFLSLRRLGGGIVQFAIAVAIYIFHSKNILSATVRALLAGSI
jgi:hypothetical protein